MSMVFVFKMLSDDNDNFVRDYEVVYDMNLLDLHKFICADLKYDPDNMVSFFVSNANWEKLQEYTLFDMGEDTESSEGAPIPMERVTIGQIIHHKHDRLIYLFDVFADRGLFLELMEAKKQDPSVEYPRVALREADAPDQFDPNATSGSGGSIFDDIMSDFNDFEGDDSYDDQ